MAANSMSHVNDRIPRTDPAISRAGAVRPSLAGAVRPSLVRAVFSKKMHDIVKDIQIPTYGKRDETAKYLKGLLQDIGFLEEALKQFNLPISCLPVLYRKLAIEEDCKAMGVDVESYTTHQTYFKSIAQSPHKILAHLSVHYLGFLSGGQAFAPILRRNFGDGATHLYQYERKGLLAVFDQEMKAYLDTLSDQDFEEFKTESQQAWIFACDLFGEDVREYKCPCDRMKKLWGDCTRSVWRTTASWRWKTD